MISVKYKPLANIKPYSRTIRKHDDKHISQLVASINAFNFNNPILIDESGEIIAGYGRYLAAQKLNMSEVPVIVLNHLSGEQKRAYRIADNKLTINSKWDENFLAIEISELKELSFDLSPIGFEIAELDVLTGKLNKLNNTEENKIPEVTEAISKLGDVWILGNHRIVCGNSLEAKYYKQLMNNKKAQMVFTDPPYNVKIAGHVCGNGKVKHKEFAMASGEMTIQEFTEFLNIAFSMLTANTTDGSLHYICMDWRHMGELLSAASVYTELKNLCVWNKDNGGMGTLYRSKHELVFVYKNGKNTHVNNIQLGKYGRYRTNVWDYAGVNSFGGNKEDLKLHPTVKPVDMIADAILDASNPKDIVLDSFLGSGSTLIACEKSGRVCYGMELEPIYVDTAIIRWQKYTGKNAVHGVSGKKYGEKV